MEAYTCGNIHLCPPLSLSGRGLTGTVEGEELTQTAQETFDSRASAVNSGQHSVQVREQGKQFMTAEQRIIIGTE